MIEIAANACTPIQIEKTKVRFMIEGRQGGTEDHSG